MRLPLIACFPLMFASFKAFSHQDDQKQIVPASEKLGTLKAPEIAKKTQGVESIIKLGHVDLDQEFKGMQHRQLRARKITIKPGGVVGIHQHQSRPGFAYILQGEIFEHRQGMEPQLRKAGDISFEQTGVTHWWHNRSKSAVIALVADIILEKPTASH